MGVNDDTVGAGVGGEETVKSVALASVPPGVVPAIGINRPFAETSIRLLPVGLSSADSVRRLASLASSPPNEILCTSQ